MSEEPALCGPSQQPLLCRHGCRTVIASRNLQRVLEVSPWAPAGQAGGRARAVNAWESFCPLLGESRNRRDGFQCCPVFSRLSVLQQQRAVVKGRMGAGLGGAAPTAPHGGAQFIMELATFPHPLWGGLFWIPC